MAGTEGACAPRVSVPCIEAGFGFIIDERSGGGIDGDVCERVLVSVVVAVRGGWGRGWFWFVCLREKTDAVGPAELKGIRTRIVPRIQGV